METITPGGYREHLATEGGPLTRRSDRDSLTVDLEQRSPIVSIAVHHSHRVREELAERMAISPEDRRYEEDPETERFLRSTTHRLTPNQSRYEVDMNRPPDTAVYLTPDMAWGNQLWETKPTREQIEVTLERWYEFHSFLDAAVQDAIRTFGQAIVLDVHSYNYQRDGATDWREDDQPEVNLGTRHLDLDEDTRALKDWFFEQLETITVLDEPCQVEENGAFYGGYVNRRLARTYGTDCLPLSVEFKKIFMDERTGEVDQPVLDDLLEQFDRIVHRLGERVEAPVLDTPREPETVG